MLNKTVGVLKYVHDKIGAGVINETEYLNTCEYGPHYMEMVHIMAPQSSFALISPINIQLS